jgi:hypothetical protein
LQSVEERAIVLYEVKLVFGLGIKITLNCLQETGTLRLKNRLLSIPSKQLTIEVTTKYAIVRHDVEYIVWEKLE